MRGERQELRDMLTIVALGRYADYGTQGDYRYPVEVRVAAAAALLRDYAHEETEITQRLADALEECVQEGA